ncbi:MAG: ribosome silencing factor [Clostridiales bacterium]|nr:ribosome silencing factor [Clostridiales bacterium]
MEGFTNGEFAVIQAAWKALDDKFAVDITVLDIRSVSTLADCFIIAAGHNPTQIRAMADEVEQRLESVGVPLRHAEGRRTMNWILLDFGSLIVHIFDKENRSFYNLERVWRDAKVIPSDVLAGMSTT